MKVLCVLPNAADMISGVKFEPVDNGMLSEEVDEKTAAAFCAINGYRIAPVLAQTRSIPDNTESPKPAARRGRPRSVKQ